MTKHGLLFSSLWVQSSSSNTATIKTWYAHAFITFLLENNHSLLVMREVLISEKINIINYQRCTWGPLNARRTKSLINHLQHIKLPNLLNNLGPIVVYTNPLLFSAAIFVPEMLSPSNHFLDSLTQFNTWKILENWKKSWFSWSPRFLVCWSRQERSFFFRSF